MKEGVIKFSLSYQEKSLEEDLALIGGFNLLEFNRVRNLCISKSWIGQDSNRYDGLGFGNLSIRSGLGCDFVISGSQTGYMDHLTCEHLSRVDNFDINDNSLSAYGLCKPSSESLTHAVIYAARPDVNAVIHIHDYKIWHGYKKLALKAIAGDVEYGTVAMAQAVEKLVVNDKKMNSFVMLGHEDGVLSFAESLASAYKILFFLGSRL